MMQRQWIFIVVLITFFLQACVAVNKKSIDKQEITALNLTLAQSYYEKGQFAVSEEKALKALEYEPDNISANSLLALIYNQQGKMEAAEEQFDKTLDLTEENSVEFAEVSNNYAILLCQNGLWPKAESYFKDAVNVKAYKTRDSALENAGMCALRAKDYANAELYFNKALSENARMHRSRLGLAKVKAESGDWAAVESSLQYYHKLTKPVEESLYLAVMAARNLNKKESAKAQLEQLQTMFPNSEYLGKLSSAHQ